MLANETQIGGGSGWFRRLFGPTRTIRGMVRGSWAVVEEHRRAYVLLNLSFYGLMAAAMAYVAFFDPALQKTLWDEVGRAFGTTPLTSEVVDAYSGGQVVLAAALTFAVNLVLGSFAMIAVPSLVVPFSGLLVGVYRALLWGLLFSPTAFLGAGMLVHWPTLLLEGQAYILAMLAAYAQGLAFLRPRAVGAKTRKEGYWVGVKRAARVYALVAIVLFVAAIYEAVSVIFIMQGAA
jgi:hypothetical protein